jgi:MYXO-CTERM domain-containing protein
MRINCLLIAGCFAALAAHAAHGEVIMSNLDAADDVGGTLFGPDANTVFKAYGWTMPGDAYFLDAVTLRLAAYDQGEARVSIWEGETEPVNELTVLDNPVGPGMKGYFNLDFTPAGSFTLEAGSTYWVYVEALDGGGNGFLWGDTDPPTMPSGLGTSVGYLFNGNPSSFFNAVEISGTLVPAPGALALFGLAALTRRRRRKLQ